MPQFQYRALNSQGHELQGTLSAPDANAAVQQLSRQGLRIRTIEEGVTVVRQPMASPPVARSPIEPVRSAKINLLAQRQTVTAIQPRRTKTARNDELFFLFSQLSNLLKGGISPADSLGTMSTRSSNQKYVDPLRDMARMAGEGGSLGTALEHYPDLFAPGIVGAVKAGEEGGYLPDACLVVSEQCHETHKLMRLYWWLGWVVLLAGVVFAGAFSMRTAIDRGIEAINGRQSDMNPIWEGVRDAFLGPVGVGLFVFLAVFFWIKIFLRQTRSRRRRHEIAYRAPLIGKRVATEGLALFTWHLNKLGQAGLSPFASWNLAARAVPNMAFSERLLALGQNMNEKTKYSQLFYASKLFPHEISAIIETGEVSGEVGTSLEQAMDYARGEQQSVDSSLKTKAGCWGLLLMVGGGMIAFWIFYGYYLKSAFRVLE